MNKKLPKYKVFCYHLFMEYNLKHYAYIGDCIWELFIRNIVINKTQSQKLMHEFTTKYVCASKQADILNIIEKYLNEDEIELQKRGRNLKITINKKSNPKIHSLATSFEVLIGFWYLNDKNRLDEIFNIIKKEIKDLNYEKY